MCLLQDVSLELSGVTTVPADVVRLLKGAPSCDREERSLNLRLYKGLFQMYVWQSRTLHFIQAPFHVSLPLVTGNLLNIV